MDEAMSPAPGEAEKEVALAGPTLDALGLTPRQPTLGSEVAASALGLLDTAPEVSALVAGVTEPLDELIVGVVEAVEECVLAPAPDYPNLCTRAEREAASWVDDFIADDAHDEDVVAQQAMFQLACLVADAVAEALNARTQATDRPRKVRCLRVSSLDLRRVADELGRRGVEAVRWSVQLVMPPLKWLHREAR